MPQSSHPPRLNYSNSTWRRVQLMKLFVMQFSPFSCHLKSFLHPALISETKCWIPTACKIQRVYSLRQHHYETEGLARGLSLPNANYSSYRNRSSSTSNPPPPNDVACTLIE
jgi:hypothetical protein